MRKSPDNQWVSRLWASDHINENVIFELSDLDYLLATKIRPARRSLLGELKSAPNNFLFLGHGSPCVAKQQMLMSLHAHLGTELTSIELEVYQRSCDAVVKLELGTIEASLLLK